MPGKNDKRGKPVSEPTPSSPSTANGNVKMSLKDLSEIVRMFHYHEQLGPLAKAAAKATATQGMDPISSEPDPLTPQEVDGPPPVAPGGLNGRIGCLLV